MILPPLALRIGLLRSSALQDDGHIKPVMLQCRTPQETNPEGHWGVNYFMRNAPLNGDVDLLAGSDYVTNNSASIRARQCWLIKTRMTRLYTKTRNSAASRARQCLFETSNDSVY